MGKAIALFFPLLPASLYGMVLFTLCLQIKLLQADRIKASIEWALSNMGVCFVPAGVGIINQLELIKNHGIALVTITFLTTFLLLTLVGIGYQRHLNHLSAINKINISTGR
jgi:holin-like protein